MRERIPRIAEAPKVINPMPGLWTVPIPMRMDSAKTKMETSSQKKLLV